MRVLKAHKPQGDVITADLSDQNGSITLMAVIIPIQLYFFLSLVRYISIKPGCERAVT